MTISYQNFKDMYICKTVQNTDVVFDILKSICLYIRTKSTSQHFLNTKNPPEGGEHK